MDRELCRKAFEEHFSTANYIGSVRANLWTGWAAAWEELSNKQSEKIEWPTSQEIADAGERCRQEVIKQRTQHSLPIHPASQSVLCKTCGGPSDLHYRDCPDQPTQNPE